jgi:hypothetical protein
MNVTSKASASLLDNRDRNSASALAENSVRPSWWSAQEFTLLSVFYELTRRPR